MAVSQIQKLVRTVKVRVVRVMPIGASIFETEFVVSPTARTDYAKAGLDAFSSIIRDISLRIHNQGRKAGIVDSGEFAIKAEVDQFAAALADQTLIPAENGRTRIGLFLL